MREWYQGNITNYLRISNIAEIYMLKIGFDDFATALLKINAHQHIPTGENENIFILSFRIATNPIISDNSIFNDYGRSSLSIMRNGDLKFHTANGNLYEFLKYDQIVTKFMHWLVNPDLWKALGKSIK